MIVLGMSGRGRSEAENDAQTGENKSNNLFHKLLSFA